MTYGVVYIALDQLVYLGMTLLSIRSLRASGNEVHVSVITNIPREAWAGQEEMGYSVIPFPSEDVPDDRKVGKIKTEILELTPYCRTLLLDADVMFLSPADEVWLGEEHLAFAVDPCQTIAIVREVCPSWGSNEGWEATIGLLGTEACHYNIGVLRIDRTPEMASFLEIWKTEINRFSPPDLDENAFVRALSIHQTQFAVLDGKFNSAFRKFHPDQRNSASPSIVHFNGIPPMQRSKLMLNVFRKYFSEGR